MIFVMGCNLNKKEAFAKPFSYSIPFGRSKSVARDETLPSIHGSNERAVGGQKLK
jgi:hypothetical protein